MIFNPFFFSLTLSLTQLPPTFPLTVIGPSPISGNPAALAREAPAEPYFLSPSHSRSLLGWNAATGLLDLRWTPWAPRHTKTSSSPVLVEAPKGAPTAKSCRPIVAKVASASTSTSLAFFLSNTTSPGQRLPLVAARSREDPLPTPIGYACPRRSLSFRPPLAAGDTGEEAR